MKSVMLNVAGNCYVRITKCGKKICEKNPPLLLKKIFEQLPKSLIKTMCFQIFKTGWNSVFLKTGMDAAGIAFVSAPLYKEGSISAVLSKS